MFSQEQRTIAFVPRWTIARTINRQYVDGHSYFVVLYTSQLCKWLALDDHTTLACITRAIWHDQSELGTSDIPGPSKRNICDKAKLKAFERRIHERYLGGEGVFVGNALADRVVKVADIFDACMFMATEYQMGNKLVARPILENVRLDLNRAIKDLVQDVTRYMDLSNLLNRVIDHTCTSSPEWPHDEPEAESVAP